jgi:hypothetical protein
MSTTVTGQSFPVGDVVRRLGMLQSTGRRPWPAALPRGVRRPCSSNGVAFWKPTFAPLRIWARWSVGPERDAQLADLLVSSAASPRRL